MGLLLCGLGLTGRAGQVCAGAGEASPSPRRSRPGAAGGRSCSPGSAQRPPPGWPERDGMGRLRCWGVGGGWVDSGVLREDQCMGRLRCWGVGGGWADSGGLREDQCQPASWQPLNLASHSGLKTCLGHRHHHGGVGLWRHLEARLSPAPGKLSPLGPWLYSVSFLAQSPPPPERPGLLPQPRAPEPLFSVLPAFPPTDAAQGPRGNSVSGR